jgi:hypothetical protein
VGEPAQALDAPAADELVRVEDQDPAPARLVAGEVLLGRVVVEVALVEPHVVARLGDVDRSVAAASVHDDDLVAHGRQRVDHRPNGGLIVLTDDDAAQMDTRHRAPPACELDRLCSHIEYAPHLGGFEQGTDGSSE